MLLTCSEARSGDHGIWSALTRKFRIDSFPSSRPRYLSRSVRFRVQSAPLSVVYRLTTALVSCLNPHFLDIHTPLPRYPRPSTRVHPLPFPCKPFSSTDTTLILPPLQAHSPPSPSRAPVKPPQPVSCQRPTPIPTSPRSSSAPPRCGMALPPHRPDTRRDNADFPLTPPLFRLRYLSDLRESHDPSLPSRRSASPLPDPSRRPLYRLLCCVCTLDSFWSILPPYDAHSSSSSSIERPSWRGIYEAP